ncbi:MAG: hypothetical protein KAY32_08510 [Candidatus Eisenbacteria sp.]|nr:hypothetical protein [Candidatus Eisenbacteria bacterium]
MLPGIYEFQWTLGHLIFLGAFFTVLGILVSVLFVSLRKSRIDLQGRRAEVIRWQQSFQQLPADQRQCRHALAGRTQPRVCQRGFACGECPFHARLLASGTAPRTALFGEGSCPAGSGDLFGFAMPASRLYHRGHTWVEQRADGTLVAGLDDLGSRLIGAAPQVELPAIGTEISAQGTGWQICRAGADPVHVLAPVSGTVIATGGPEKGWYLRLQPVRIDAGLEHLLHGEEIRPWVQAELQRLQRRLSPECLGPSLADGGLPVADFPAAYPGVDWDTVWSETFLTD